MQSDTPIGTLGDDTRFTVELARSIIKVLVKLKTIADQCTSPSVIDEVEAGEFIIDYYDQWLCDYLEELERLLFTRNQQVVIKRCIPDGATCCLGVLHVSCSHIAKEVGNTFWKVLANCLRQSKMSRWNEIRNTFAHYCPNPQLLLDKINHEYEVIEYHVLNQKMRGPGVSSPEPAVAVILQVEQPEFKTGFHELLAGIDLKNLRVTWRGMFIPCPRNYLTIIKTLCEARIEGVEYQSMRDLIKRNPQLDGVRVDDASDTKIDPRLLQLIDRPGKQMSKRGYCLRNPSEVLLPLS